MYLFHEALNKYSPSLLSAGNTAERCTSSCLGEVFTIKAKKQFPRGKRKDSNKQTSKQAGRNKMQLFFTGQKWSTRGG